MPVKVARDGETGQFYRKHYCESCSPSVINGVFCHEAGCPGAWKDEVRKCNECGCDFKPEERFQVYCDSHCANMSYGLYCDCDICREMREEEKAERDCEWCGGWFEPEDDDDHFCSHHCCNMYMKTPCDCDKCQKMRGKGNEADD